MYNAIKAGTTDTYMLWSPNVDVEATPNYLVRIFHARSQVQLLKTAQQTYYPGADFVDLHGLSMYAIHKLLDNRCEWN